MATQAAAHYEQAVAHARSHLTAAVHASPLVAGDWQGDDGAGFHWHLRVAPIASTAVRPGLCSHAARIVEVSADIVRGDGMDRLA